MFSGPALLLLLAGVLVLVVASLFAQGATFLAVSDLYLSRPVKISDCLRRAWSEILTVFAVGILSGLAIVAGLICLIVPGIYIMCRLIVSVPSALIEQRGPAEAVGRSWRLTAGNAGRAFVVIFVYFVIAMAAAMLVQLPFTIALFMVRNNLGLVQVLTAVAQVGSSVVNTIVSPIFMIATSVFYFDLRVRKEGFDLQFMMDPTSERLTPPGTGSIPSILS
jgi:membrane-associated PAP2 superfamily phosphatase